MLDDEVLHVRAEVGEPPGDVVVVPSDDEGRAGEGHSGGVEGGLRCGIRGLQVGLVPEFGHAEREVHVVREQRPSRGGARAGDSPCVGAGDTGGAGSLEEGEGPIEGEKVGRGGGGGGRVLAELRLRLVEGDVVELGLGRGDVGHGLAGVVIAPGAGGVEIGDEVW